MYVDNYSTDSWYYVDPLQTNSHLMTNLLVLFQARLCLVSCRVGEISGKISSIVSLIPDIMILSPISGDTLSARTSQSWSAL